MDETTIPQKGRISNINTGVLLSVAVLFDLLNGLINLVPLAGQVLSDIITIIAYLTFALWFFLLHVSVFDSKRAARFFGTGVIEMIPVVNVLPAITLGVFLTISMVKLEDKGLAPKLPTAKNVVKK